MLASWVRQEESPDSLVRARELALEGVAAHPDSVGGRRCRHLVAAIEAPEYSLEAMSADGLDRRSVRVHHRNVYGMSFRAWRLDPLATIESAADRNLLPAHREVEELLASRRPDVQWRVELPATAGLPAAPDLRHAAAGSSRPVGAGGVAAGRLQRAGEPPQRGPAAGRRPGAAQPAVRRPARGNRPRRRQRPGRRRRRGDALPLRLAPRPPPGGEPPDRRGRHGRFRRDERQRGGCLPRPAPGRDRGRPEPSRSPATAPPRRRHPRWSTPIAASTGRCRSCTGRWSPTTAGGDEHFRGRPQRTVDGAASRTPTASGSSAPRSRPTTSARPRAASTCRPDGCSAHGGWTPSLGGAPRPGRGVQAADLRGRASTSPTRPLRLNRQACSRGEARYYFGLPVTDGPVALARDPRAGVPAAGGVVVPAAAGRRARWSPPATPSSPPTAASTSPSPPRPTSARPTQGVSYRFRVDRRRHRRGRRDPLGRARLPARLRGGRGPPRASTPASCGPVSRRP